MCTGFNLKSPAALAPNKGVSLSFEALDLGIVFSSLAMLSSGWHLPQIEGLFVSIENLLFSIATCVNYLSQIIWMMYCGLYTSTCCFILHFQVLEMASFLKPHAPTSAHFELVSLQLPHLSQLSETWRELGPCSGLGFGIKECCG